MNNLREILAKTLMAEAGGEGPQGMLAAGAVMQNRVRTGGYGNDLHGVIMKPGQFSAWNGVTGYANGQGALDMHNMRPSETAYQVADMVLSGNYQDPTGGATHYYNPSVANPKWGERNGGKWSRIGNHIFGNADAGRVSSGASTPTVAGGLSMTPSSPPDHLQGAQMQPNQQPNGLLGRMFPNMEEEQRERIRYGLANLGSLSVVGPNARVMDQIDKRRDTRQQDAKLNHTIEWLAKQPGGEKFAQAAAAGIPVNQAFNAYRQEMQAANDPSVQSSTSLPDMSGSVVTMRDGSQSVITAGGERLTGQEAMDFVARAQQAYTDQQRSVYGARRGGSLEADIELGGDAERAKQEGKMAPVTAKEFSQNASVIRSSIVNMDDALSALDRGANSGVVYKMLPAVSEASASLRNSMNRLGLDVIGSVTFGALSQAEMQLAMETAVPRNLEPEALRDWLTRKRAAQVKAYQAAMEAAQHFASGGTQADYYASIGLPAAPQPSAPSAGGPQTQMPDLTQMSDEQLQAIIDGGQP